MPPQDTQISQLALKIDGSGAPEDVMDDLVRVEVDQNLHLPTMFSLTLAFRNLEWLERLKSDGPAREVVFRTLRRNPSFADTPESLTNHDLVMTIEALLAEGLLPSFEKGLAPTSPNP